jgi:hypothetical protein
VNAFLDENHKLVWSDFTVQSLKISLKHCVAIFSYQKLLFEVVLNTALRVLSHLSRYQTYPNLSHPWISTFGLMKVLVTTTALQDGFNGSILAVGIYFYLLGSQFNPVFNC